MFSGVALSCEDVTGAAVHGCPGAPTRLDAFVLSSSSDVVCWLRLMNSKGRSRCVL